MFKCMALLAQLCSYQTLQWLEVQAAVVMAAALNSGRFKTKLLAPGLN